MISCKSFNNLITKYLDGNISDCEQNQLMEHVSYCDTCEIEYVKYSSILEVLNEKVEIDLPETFESDVMKQIQLINLREKRLKEKKLKEKKLLKLYFTASMVFTLMLILAGAVFKEQVLSIMLYLSIPPSYANSIYIFLEEVSIFGNVIKNILLYLNAYIYEMYFLLIGLASLVFISKAYIPKNKKKSEIDT